MTYRVRNIAVAIGLALVAALLTTFYVANYKRHVQHSEATVPVWVAARDIPAGTPGSMLVSHHWISQSQVVQRTVAPGAIVDPAQISRLLVTQPIYQGDQVTLRRFATQNELGIRVQLHGTLRAIALTGTAEELLNGTLRTGDHVDLVANFDPKNGLPFTRDVARNLLVLSAEAPSTASKVSSGNQNPSVILATNEVNQVQKVWFAVQNASGWSLQLRAPSNATDSPEDVETYGSIYNDGVSAKELAHAAKGQ
jgi:Flp pilus assembly protein CpaB